MKKKVLFIFNPYSGKGQIKNNLLDIIDVLVKTEHEVTVYPTQFKKQAVSLVENRSPEYDLIVCSGGDGTLDEIVTGMIQSGFKTPIGYIPAGSTNDFAKSLELPTNMKSAAEVVAAGKLFPCDVGLFNNDVFVYIAAFGLFTEVSYETPQEMKNVLGHMAYILEGVKQFQNIKSYHMKVAYKEDDIEKTIEDDFIFGMITNSFSVGGFKTVLGNVTGKNVALNDGLFEVTLVKRPRNPIELNSILVALVSEKIDTEYMYCFKAKELVLESQTEVAWTLDGEFGGNQTRVELTDMHEAMDIIVG